MKNYVAIMEWQTAKEDSSLKNTDQAGSQQLLLKVKDKMVQKREVSDKGQEKKYTAGSI